MVRSIMKMRQAFFRHGGFVKTLSRFVPVPDRVRNDMRLELS